MVARVCLFLAVFSVSFSNARFWFSAPSETCLAQIWLCPVLIVRIELFSVFFICALDFVAQVWQIKGTMKAKKEWPKTVRVGNVSVQVYKRLTGSGNVGFRIAFLDTDGKRKFESCSDETQVITLATKKAEMLSTFGARVAGTSGDQIAEFVRLGDVLKPFAVSVAAVVTRAPTWLQRHGTLDAIDCALITGPALAGVAITPRTVPAAVAELLAQKRANKMSEAYCRDIEFRLQNKFAKAFTCNVDTVETSQLQAWLDARNMPASTYRNFGRLLNTLFEFCKRRNYCTNNPAADLEKRKVNGGDVVIYSPDEMRKLLEKSDNGFQLMLAVCGFAGIRTAEFMRLTWEDVCHVPGHIEVPKGKGKNKNRRRLVPISPNLAAWIALHPARKGLLWPDQKRVDDVQRRCGKLAGVPWKKNALRHSFCTYKTALSGDIARTSLEAGNSVKMIEEHYDRVVTQEAAREWFAIMPPAKPV